MPLVFDLIRHTSVFHTSVTVYQKHFPFLSPSTKPTLHEGVTLLTYRDTTPQNVKQNNANVQRIKAEMWKPMNK